MKVLFECVKRLQRCIPETFFLKKTFNFIKNLKGVFVIVFCLGTSLPGMDFELSDPNALMGLVRDLCVSGMMEYSLITDGLAHKPDQCLDFVRKVIKKTISSVGLEQKNPLFQCRDGDSYVRKFCTVQTQSGWKIITALENADILLWDASTGQMIERWAQKGTVKALAAMDTRDGVRVVIGSEKRLTVWDQWEGGRVVIGSRLTVCDQNGQRQARAHIDRVDSIKLLEAEGNWHIITTGHNAPITFWNMDCQKIAHCNLPLYESERPDTRPLSIVNTPAGPRILAALKEETFGIWNFQGDLLGQGQGHDEPINSLYAVMTEGGLLTVSGSDDNKVGIWKNDGDFVRFCQGHTAAVTTVSALSDKQETYIVSGSDDYTVRMWNILGEQLAQYQHQNILKSLGAVKDDKLGIVIFSVAQDGRVFLRNLQGHSLGECRSHYYVELFDTPEGWRIISRDARGPLVWDILDVYRKLEEINFEQARAIVDWFKKRRERYRITSLAYQMLGYETTLSQDFYSYLQRLFQERQ